MSHCMLLSERVRARRAGGLGGPINRVHPGKLENYRAFRFVEMMTPNVESGGLTYAARSLRGEE